MSSFRVRPRFRHVIPFEPEITIEKIDTKITEKKDRCEVKRFPEYLCLRIPEEQLHFWSPQLTLNIEPIDSGKTVINGVYGPNANVWSIFLYAYLTAGSIALFSGCLGVAQLLIDHQAWGFWIFWPALAAIVIFYLTAQFGQKLGASQTYQLHQAYEDSIGASVEIR